MVGQVLAGFLATGLGTGCVVSVGGDGSRGAQDRPRHEVPKPAPMPPPAVTPEDAGVIAEIDAVSKLGFEASRLEVLTRVAQRAGLSPGCQVHLVNTGLRWLEFEASRVNLLQAVIQNPAFAPAGKEAILRQLEYLQFEASRQQVVRSVQERTAGW